MFNSIAFDVVIGMVFVYLLYSLLTTILAEMFSSWIGLRALVLRRAIERMLNDGEIDGKAIKGNLFLRQPEDFQYTFAGRFYNYPSIKYMSEGSMRFLSFRPGKPSYMTKEIFAQTLVHLFRSKGDGKCDIEKIDFCLKFNTLHIQPQTLTYLRNQFNDANGNINAFIQNLQNWFTETQYRANGWFKRKNRLILFCIGLLLAISFNIDSIRIAGLLSKDKDARNQLVNMGIALSKDTTKYKDYVRGNADSIRVRAVLDSGFVHVTKDIGEANSVLGLGWNFPKETSTHSQRISSNDEKASTIKKRRHLWNTRDLLQSSLSIVRTRLSDLDSAEIAGLRDSLIMIDRNFQSPPLLDTLSPRPVSKGKSTKNKNTLHHAGYSRVTSNSSKEEIDDISVKVRLTRFEQQLSEKLHDYQDSIDNATRELNNIFKGKFSSIDWIEVTTDSVVVHGKSSQGLLLGMWNGLCFIVSASMPWKPAAWGFLITALALSLGAPFWFDLLQKLVSLRGSGVKPEEKNNPATPQSDQPLQGGDRPLDNGHFAGTRLDENIQKSNSASEMAVENFKKRYLPDERIIDVIQGFKKRNDKMVEIIEVHVRDFDSITTLSRYFGNDFDTFEIEYLPNTEAKVHAIECGKTIYTDSNINGIGTLGCFVRRIDSDKKYLLSCWHILKGAINFANGFNSTIDVFDANKNVVAKVVDGFIGSKFDIGFAELVEGTTISNKSINIKHDWREISPNEHFMSVQFLGAANAMPRGAVIYRSTIPQKEIHYPDGNVKTLSDLFTITTYKEDGTHQAPSQGGDSGSVVVDNNGFPLGVVVGGDMLYTYVAKFSNALSEHSNFHEYKILT